MSMKMLNTRVALRTDTHDAWETNKNQKLLKGEIGIEIFPNGKKKMKIGDGTANSVWSKLEYFGASGAMTGAEAPTETTLADVGTVYVTNGGLIYVCTANTGEKATWVQLGTSEDANTTYKLETLTDTAKAQIKMTASDDSGNSELTIAGGTNIKVKSDNLGAITIDSTAPDTGAIAVTTDGSGDAVNGATYSAENRTITLHKNYTFTETPITVTDASTGNGLVTAIAKGGDDHTIVTTKGVTYANVISGEGSASILPTTKAVNDFVTTKMSTVDAMRYKGTVDDTHNLPTTEVKKGDTYKVTFAKSYLGKAAKVGDLFIANVDSASTGDGWDLIPSGDDGNTFHSTLTKNTVVLGESENTVKSLANGSNGQVLKLVNGVPTWAKDEDTKFELKPASASALGGFETGYTGGEKEYAVQMKGNKAYVAVPWKNTEYQDVISNGTSGLMSGADKKKLDDLKNYTLPTASSDTLGGIKAEQATKGTGKVYDVKLDSTTKKPFVQVDWTNTTYTAKSNDDLKLAGTEFEVQYSKNNLTTDLNADPEILVLYGGNAEGKWPQA